MLYMQRPENVRIIRRDGTVIPCELGYVGVDNNGMDVWSVATVAFPGDLLQIDDMPDEARIVGASIGALPVPMKIVAATSWPQAMSPKQSLIRDALTLAAGTPVLVLIRIIHWLFERMDAR